MTVLAVHDVSLSLGGRSVLEHCSISVDAGRWVALIGPNGAGKSSLLRLLSGELRATEGSIAFDGRPLVEWSGRERARRLAVVAQNEDISFPLRASELVLLGRVPHGSTDLVLAVDRALSALGLEALADRSVLELSGGELRRVVLARALAQLDSSLTPRCALLDEPTSGLDLQLRHRALGAYRNFVDSGGALLAAMHDFDLVWRYADEVVLLEAGRVVASGATETVLLSAAASRVFQMRFERVVQSDGTPTLVTRPMG